MLGTVYKLYNPNSDFVYIGSTTNYTNRKSLHKFCCKLGNSGNKLYEFIRNNGGFTSWEFKICEEIMVSKPHCPKLLKLEKKYCDKYENTLNQREILRDKKKYYIDHRPKIIARSKLDEINNKERNKERRRLYYLKHKERISCKMSVNEWKNRKIKHNNLLDWFIKI